MKGFKKLLKNLFYGKSLDLKSYMYQNLSRTVKRKDENKTSSRLFFLSLHDGHGLNGQ